MCSTQSKTSRRSFSIQRVPNSSIFPACGRGGDTTSRMTTTSSKTCIGHLCSFQRTQRTFSDCAKMRVGISPLSCPSLLFVGSNSTTVCIGMELTTRSGLGHATSSYDSSATTFMSSWRERGSRIRKMRSNGLRPECPSPLVGSTSRTPHHGGTGVFVSRKRTSASVHWFDRIVDTIHTLNQNFYKAEQNRKKRLIMSGSACPLGDTFFPNIYTITGFELRT